MTREEAILVLQKIKPTPYRGDGKSTTHTLETIALDIAIKALEQQPSDDEIILTKEEYGHLLSSEFDNGYAKGYREALEQESVLDKILVEIKTEIKGYKSTIDNAISEDELKIEGMKEAYTDCLEIIDKYMAERSE